MPRVKLKQLLEPEVEHSKAIKQLHAAPPSKEVKKRKGWNRNRQRVTSYDPLKSPLQIYQLRLLGTSDLNIARVFGVNWRTIKNWFNRYEDFQRAYMAGGELADGEIAGSLHKMAKGYVEKETKVSFDREGNAHTVEIEVHVPPDREAAKHWLSKRQRRKWNNDSKSTTNFYGGSSSDGRPSSPTIVINPVISLPSTQATKTIEHEGKITDA